MKKFLSYITILMLLILILNPNPSMAQSYSITGAGTSAVNGTYNPVPSTSYYKHATANYWLIKSPHASASNGFKYAGYYNKLHIRTSTTCYSCALYFSNGLTAGAITSWIIPSCNNPGVSPVPSISVLPVTWLEFNIKTSNEANQIFWSTAMELNNEKFIIERGSDNGDTWEIIAEQTGAGTSNEINKYEYVDLNPIKGINFYRVKQVDYDGKFEYSVVGKALNTELVREFDLVSNKTSDFIIPVLTFEMQEEETVKLDVVGLNGLTIKSVLLSTSGNLNVNVKDLKDGIYFVRVATRGKQYTEKFLKFGS